MTCSGLGTATIQSLQVIRNLRVGFSREHHHRSLSLLSACVYVLYHMALPWSTPTRQTDTGAVLPFIPNEIYIEIFDSVLPLGRFGEQDAEAIDTLMRATLVCRFFYHLASSRIFESLVVRLDDQSNATGANHVALDSWAHAIVAGDPAAVNAAAHVKRGVLIGDRHRDRKPDDIIARRTRLLTQLPNIERVEFVNCAIAPAHIAVLLELRGLRRIAARDCSWVQPDIDMANWTGDNGGTVNPSAVALGEGFSTQGIEDLEIADHHYVLDSPTEWACQVLATASQTLRRVALTDAKSLTLLIHAYNTRWDAQPTCHFPAVREVHLQLPSQYDDELRMFSEARTCAESFPALERLVIFVEWPRDMYRRNLCGNSRGIRPLDSPRKFAHSFIKAAGVRMQNLHRFEILDSRYDSTYMFFKRHITDDLLHEMVDKVCPNLEYFRFGPLEWTPHLGSWKRTMKSSIDRRDIFE
ncbi:hypothetical protein CONPUDRAFT_167701 [Coniophora puteana RWD-64-598 SS2]|uniref:F-box domain-containing protein n=1 Tax=Coniophora puteana (strain RWD-64-598) TaxID=741705 RepID=A0A5M3MFY6_CONPW|nr:uncharacterized protein CONPUDRAFT_167701 [Coniophora puteana RWD-64-598 SS2]EIW77511.1 hypothetical protein CONPUDRAFT_167701 [Coniophora puteana RWD-64-598 SS2]